MTTASALANEMSLADQLAQMSQIDVYNLVEKDDAGNIRWNDAAVEEWIGRRGVGSVLNFVADARWTVEDYRAALRKIQSVAQQYHRPPVLYGIDSVHGGNYFYGATTTPQPLNLAASFNVTTAWQAGQMASRQTRAAGITWLFSPLLGLALEPRWSRVYETFGEDGVLVSACAAAMIRGIQEHDKDDGDDDDDDNDDSATPTTPKITPTRAAACAKHFVGYSKPINGHDRSPSWIPTRHLYQYFVPPWKRAVQEAGVLTVMESYTETDGVPNVANAVATEYLLRQRLNFTGVLVTDYQEIENLFGWHKTVPSLEAAVPHALQQGSVDMSMLPSNMDNFVGAATKAVETTHQLSPERIRESAERILQLKLDLNMMNEDISPDSFSYPYHERDHAEAMDMVRQSIVLTKNQDNILPLKPQGQKILITGPTANSLAYQSGGWTGAWQGPPQDWFTYGSTVVGAFTKEPSWDVSYRCGVDILGNSCDDAMKDEKAGAEAIWDNLKDWVGLSDADSSIARAADAASSADIVVIALGEEPYAEKPADMRSLDLPEGQYELVRKIRSKASAKIVLVYFGGRPRLLRQVVDLVDVAVIGFLPGPSAGDALLEIVTGKVNPSARLPITYPLYDDGGGIPYFHSVSDQCTAGDGPLPHWTYTPCQVQWPFGHGLSYTTFKYTDFTAAGGIDQDLKLSVTVENTGDMTGAEAVLFFTFDQFRRTTPEYKRLRAFDKVYLKPGEKVQVEKTVPVDELRFVGPDDDTHYIIDPKMTAWAAVGADTDCRQNSDDDRCVHLQSADPDRVYVGACEAACNLWTESGCSPDFAKLCMNKCTSISQYPQSAMDGKNQGWGWNYVNCLESVVYGMKNDDKKECWKMNTLCRDVLRTGQMDQYGVGPHGVYVDPYGTTSQPSAGVTYVALIAGLFASFIIVLLMRGYTTKRGRNVNPDTEFVPIQTHDLP